MSDALKRKYPHLTESELQKIEEAFALLGIQNNDDDLYLPRQDERVELKFSDSTSNFFFK